MENKPAAPRFKVILLGEQSVGKTSLVTRFMYDTFEDAYQPTVGIDFVTKSLFFEDRGVRLQLWDTAGHERFRTLIPSYVRDAAAAIVVYDVADSKSFDEIPRWIQDVRDERGEEAFVAVVGNKTDLPEGERQVSFEQGDALAQQHSALFCETSARLGTNVDELFRQIALKLPADGPAPRPAVQGTTIKVSETPETPPASGCAC